MMDIPKKAPIPDLLVKNVSRQLILSVEEAFTVGAQRAYIAARGMDDGHLPNVVGQLRHFHMNETFFQALNAHQAAPSPIRGNGLVIGHSGVFTLGRFNAKDAQWNNARRSITRRQMSEANRAIEPLVQPGLFRESAHQAQGVAFFVACFAASLKIQPDTPVAIQIAVPDQHMRKWLFRESLDRFVQRYDNAVTAQHDLARPKLKKNMGQQLDKDGTKQ